MNNSYERVFQRGDIYYVNRAGTTTGSEQMPGRPAIIVSNNMCNTYSSTIEVVYLTTQPKSDLPTHVTIRSTSRQSTALCEQISSIDTSRIGEFVSVCTDQEMELVDTALMISLGIDAGGQGAKEVVKEVPVEVVKEVVKEVPVEVVKEVVKEVPVDSQELIATRAQVEQLQAMYNSLLERILTPNKRGRKIKEEE